MDIYVPLLRLAGGIEKSSRRAPGVATRSGSRRDVAYSSSSSMCALDEAHHPQQQQQQVQQ
jgi:hypothetical protein